MVDASSVGAGKCFCRRIEGTFTMSMLGALQNPHVSFKFNSAFEAE